MYAFVAADMVFLERREMHSRPFAVGIPIVSS